MYHPTYMCRRIAGPLAVTGKVDDPRWQQAEVAVLTDPVTGAAKKFATTARLLYDAECLYIGFTCEDDYVWGTLTARDDAIFTEECVEAFICPSGKMRQYYEINVSPLNTVYDSYVLNATRPDGPRNMIGFEGYTAPGMITRVHIDGELGIPGAHGWSAEYAIPFAALIGNDHLVPEPGDEWRLNLYRIDAAAAGKQDFYAWAQMGKIDFHLPWNFGTLKFA